MNSKLLSFFIFLLTFQLFPLNTMAAANNGEGLKDVCSLAGGRWFGEEGGYWSCCWADWGCLQCEPDGSCEMLCTTERCKDANGQESRPPRQGYTAAKDLVPQNVRAPIIPKHPRAITPIPLTKIKVKQ